jgi:CDP-glucose 4,6-dehydratase
MVNHDDIWRDRPVFVTGGNGFLGGWLVQRLLEKKANVICLLRDWTPKSVLLDTGLYNKVSIVRGDVENQKIIERTLGEYEIETVFHLAAQTIVGIANRNPVSTFNTNIKGTWTLLESCRRSPLVNQILIASSDKAYGEQKTLPYDEEMPLQGRFPYDVSKSCTDLLAQSYANTYHLPVTIARCGNLYGGGDLNWNRIIPGSIRSIQRGKSPVIRSDGEFVRDYFYVEDAAEAYIHLAECMNKQKDLGGHAFNFSNETPVTALELVQKILFLMNSRFSPIILNQASNEIRRQYLNSSKAKNMLGWNPRYSLDEGLKKTIDWYTRFLSDG